MTDKIISGNANNMNLAKFRKYNILLADPPWKQNARNNPSTRYGLGCKYDTMSIGDICSMPIKEITNERCMLFLWTTCPKLPDALHVIDAWGFKFSTVAFVWVKTNKHILCPMKKLIERLTMPNTEQLLSMWGSIIRFGTGYYTASNVELVLLGIKGKPFKHPRKHKASQVVLHPLMPEHSQKPPEIMSRIDWMYPDIKPKLELFARKPENGWFESGWDRFGNEVE